MNFIYLNNPFQILFVFLFLLWTTPGLRELSAQSNATQVITQIEKNQRGRTSISRFMITIEKARFKRKILLDSWDDRIQDKFFIRIIEPKKDKGVSFLKANNNFWQYIPKLGKEIKVEGSLMQDSWMGSDFSNDDLVKSSSIIDDYTHQFGDKSNPSEYHIILDPKPGSAIVWNRVEAIIRKSDLMPVRYEFYDHKGRLRKQQLFSDYKIMSGRKIPARLVMETIKKGKVSSRTILVFLRARFNQKISNRIFSKANLRR